VPIDLKFHKRNTIDMPKVPKTATLRELREWAERTQVEMAKRVGVPQGEISKVEGRTSHRVAIVRRYVEALGGSLEVHAVIKRKRILLRDV
jgi:predicted transcriptional regulator